MLKPHPETDGMTTPEIRAAISQAEEQLRLAKEIPDDQLVAWFSDEIQILESALARRNGESGSKKSQADTIIKMALESGAELFHTGVDDSYISFDVSDHRETWAVRSKATRHWLTRGFYLVTQKAPNSEAIQTALNLLEAKARFDGKKHEVHLRTAWHGGALYYDLCDQRWRSVQVSKSGWRIIDKSPVKFIRYRHMAGQVEPRSGGNIDDLFEFINVKSDTDRKLLRVWNIVGLIPDIPRPAQVLHGDQGSGKSTMARRQRELIDPSGMPLLKAKDEPEVVQGLAHHYCAIFDNLTSVNDWVSDLLCRAVTGEGFTKRQLYTDSEDILFAYRRLLILTGIGLVVNKPDLLDRSLIIGVERIPESLRRRERDLDTNFYKAKPKLFGALLGGLVGALKVYHKISHDRLPRMADFAAWALAVETGMGRDPEEWRRAYEINVERQNEEAIGSSVIATTLQALLEDREEWAGQPHELYALLKEKADGMKIPAKSFPGSAAVLGRKLREVRPNLSALGWYIDFREGERPRKVAITRINGENAVRPDPADVPSDSTDTKDSTDSKIPNYSCPRNEPQEAPPWEEDL
jgi:hypothetical protein